MFFIEFETDKDREQKCWSLELKLLKKVYYNAKTKCLEDGDSKTTEHSTFQGHRFLQIARVRKDFSCFLPYSILFQVLSLSFGPVSALHFLLLWCGGGVRIIHQVSIHCLGYRSICHPMGEIRKCLVYYSPIIIFIYKWFT